ncbi:MAG: aminotransferase class V-fold PLP-dependent enzyme [Candidatus Dormibacteria bacterium]
MMTHPLANLSLDEAIAMQFRYVDVVTRHFNGAEILQAGDYGVVPGLLRPNFTAKVEAVLAEFFDAEDATLVRGAGTGAIRSACMTVLAPGSSVIIHDAPVYTTSAVTFRAMGLDLQRVDFNDLDAMERAVADSPGAAVYVQHSRQLLADRYDLGALIVTSRRARPTVTILVDDNYTVMHVPRIGTQLGADLSMFSMFKLLGPIGIGAVVGREALIGRIREDAYSGGTKVQGTEAMEVLKSIVVTPVMLAVAGKVVAEVVERLNRGEIPGIAHAYLSNHQERTALVELEEPIGTAVVEAAGELGASYYPVGSASRYEIGLLVYRVSRALMEADPALASRFIRVNPFRAGPDTVLRVLRESIESARSKGAQ